MNPDTSQLDNSIVALMHGLKTSEGTNGDYNKIGDQGTAMGIGQWSNQVNGTPQKLSQGQIPTNFQSQAKQYNLDPNDFSPENQNKVMYSQLEEDKNSGLSPEQILSKWNSGDPNKYLNSATSMGSGPVGNYDVASYVKKGMSAAQQYAQQNKSSNSQLAPGVPSLTLSQDNNTQSQDKGFLGNLMSGNILGAGKNVMDFAFPIISDTVNDIQGTNQKSALQQIGDAGLSALWFIPGLGEEAGIGAKILEGAGIGYGAGTLNQISQGKGLVSAVTPNASNLIGAATGGVAGGVLSKLSDVLGKNITQEGAVSALQDNLTQAVNATKSGANLLKGLDPDTMGLVARENAIPDIVDGKLDSTVAKDVVQNNLSQIGKLRASALDQSGVRGSLPILKNKALQAADSLSGTERETAIDNINKEFSSLISQYGKQPSATDMETIKEYLQSRANYDMATPKTITKGYRIMATQAKNQMEDIAGKSGIPNIADINKLMSKHYDALDALDKINGQVIKGGRLGNILRGHTIAGVSAMGANAMGGGFLGTLGAALGGEGANALLSKVLGDTSLTNPIRESIINKIETENPDIVKALQDYLAKKGKLPSELQGKIASQLTPKSSSGIKGLIPQTINTTMSRGASSLIPLQ